VAWASPCRVILLECYKAHATTSADPPRLSQQRHDLVRTFVLSPGLVLGGALLLASGGP
jgi:hypothetical protein